MLLNEKENVKNEIEKNAIKNEISEKAKAKIVKKNF